MAQAEPITVLLPVRNGARTLGVALADILLGLCEEDELLVVDDGSEDQSPSILVNVANSDPRLRVIRTSGVGLVEALNLGLRESRFRLIARADADDRYPPDRFASQRACIRAGVVLVAGDYRFVANQEVVTDLPCALSPPFVAASLINPQRIPHPGVLLERNAVIEAGGYRSTDFPAEDLALWLRLSTLGDFVGVPAVTVDWTLSHGSITHTHQADQRRKTAVLVTTLPQAVIRGISAESVRNEVASYEGTRLEATRKLLLARDLFSLRDRGVDSGALRESWKALGREPVKALGAARQIAYEKRARDRARRSIVTAHAQR